MKHLLSGVALAALLTAGLPAPAQTTSTDKPSPAAPSTTGAKSSMPTGTDSAQSGATSPSDSTGKSGKHARRSGAAAKHGQSPSDNMAEELNRQELQRMQSGGQTTTGSGQSQAPGAGQTQGSGGSGTR